MAGKVLHAAVVGSSTLLGKELLEEIANSAAATWDLKLLDEGDDIEGQLTSAGDEALVIHALSDTSFAGLDLVLFAGSADLTRRYLKPALAAGAAVVDMSGATGQEPGFLLRSPWLEGARPDLTTTGIAVPHIAANILATIAQRLEQRFGSVELTATVLEPASQAGAGGVDELHQQTVGLLSFQDVPKAVFGTQVAFNLQATLGEEVEASLAATRARIRQDFAKLMGDRTKLRLNLMLLQAPVFHGYVATVHVRLTEQVAVDALRKALNGGVVVADEDTQPSNQAAIESGDLLVSLTIDEQEPGGAWLLLAADNLRLYARTAVQSAIELASMRPNAHVQ